MVVLGGCGASLAQRTFEGDFACKGPVSVTQTMADRYRVSGCGKTAVYTCYQAVCNIQVASQDAATASAPSSANTPARGAPSAKVDVKTTKSGDSVVSADVWLDERSLLTLSGAPEGKSKGVRVKLLLRDAERTTYRYSSKKSRWEDPESGCELRWLIDGQRIPKSPTKGSRSEGVTVYTTRLSEETLGVLSTADRISLRLCERRWSLGGQQRAELGHFVDLYEEELAWQGKARPTGLKALPPPRGGWPEWKPEDIDPMPTARAGAALESTALFNLLQASLYRVEASQKGGTSQGSAVAVSESELLTNCHVVAKARKIIVKREKAEWSATLTRSEPDSDRCVLAIDEPTLQAVRGVRTWESLEVGEPLFALGSPAGLELTLSSGILSGRREDDDVRFVQTTAPISPGSSGGGLFDARGNLVGVTTLVVAGRERLNQSLNFAIPAERFWQP
jgi:S1-C subfamily serine protease